MTNKIITAIKKAVFGTRKKRIKPLGLWATRALVFLLLVPIVLVVVLFICVCVRGYVSYDVGRVIDTGIKIIDHIFIPSVLAALTGFLSLWLDRNNNGIPDSIEKDENKNDK